MGKWKAKLNPDAAKAVKKSAPARSAMFSEEPETNKFHRTMQSGGAPAQEELGHVESSDKLGYTSKKLASVPDLTSLINFDDYFGGGGGGGAHSAMQSIDENASVEGNISDHDDDPADDAYLNLLQRQDASAVIDEAPRNDQESFFTPWEDLANDAMPGEGAVGEGGASKASLRSAAEGGLNPNWHSTTTRNARDARFLPFQQGGDKSATRQRSMPATEGQLQARRELGFARMKFNAGATPDNYLAGPRHDGTKAKTSTARMVKNGDNGDLVNLDNIRGRLKKFRRANKRQQVREEVGNWDPINKTAPAATMDVIDEVDSDLEDDRLTKFVKPDYFSQGNLDSQGEGLLDGGNEGMERILAERENASAHQATTSGGFFSRMGRSLSRAASVMGNAFSSMGQGIKSWFTSGSRGNQVTDTSSALQRVAAIHDAQAEAEHAGQYYPAVEDSAMRDNYVPEPAEVHQARRKAAIPNAESYTEEQVDNEDFRSLDRRVRRYESEAHDYAGGSGVLGAGAMLAEDRQKLAGEFFSKFRKNPRLSFGPYAQNRQEDVWDAEEAGKDNPLYPERAIGEDATSVGFTRDEETGNPINFDVNETHFMDDDQRAAHAKAESDRQDNINSTNAMIREYERPAKERALKEQQRREAEALQRQKERDDQSYAYDVARGQESMERGAEHAEALHPPVGFRAANRGRMEIDANDYYLDQLEARMPSRPEREAQNSGSTAAYTSELQLQENYFSAPDAGEVEAVQPTTAKLKPAKKAAKKPAKKAAASPAKANASKAINLNPKAALKEVPPTTGSTQKRAQISTSTADMRRLMQPAKPGLLDRIGDGVENAADGLIGGLSSAMESADALLASPEENAKAQKAKAAHDKDEAARLKENAKVADKARKKAATQQEKAIQENEAKRRKYAAKYN